jgi:hypothetical protein
VSKGGLSNKDWHKVPDIGVEIRNRLKLRRGKCEMKEKVAFSEELLYFILEPFKRNTH